MKSRPFFPDLPEMSGRLLAKSSAAATERITAVSSTTNCWKLSCNR